MNDISRQRDGNGNRNKKGVARKVILAAALTALVVIVLFLLAGVLHWNFTVQFPLWISTTNHTPTTQTPTSTTSLYDQKLLVGLWKSDAAYPYPQFLEVKEKEICTSWSGQTPEEYACLQYAPYRVEENIILVNNAAWLKWNIVDGKLELKEFNKDHADVYVKIFPRPIAKTPIPATTTTRTYAPPSKAAPKPSLQQQPSEKPKVDYAPLSPTPTLPKYRPAKPNISGPWRTYKSFDFGFQIDHPQEFMAEGGTPRAERERFSEKFVLVITWIPGPVAYGSAYVIVYRGLTEEEVIQNNSVIVDQHENSIPMVYEGETTIGQEGYQAKKFVAAGIPSFRSPGTTVGKNMAEYYLLQRNGDYYLFLLTTYNDPKNIELNRKMLSTLRFIDVEPQTWPKVKITSPTAGERWHMSGNHTHTIRWDTTPVEWYDGYGIVHSRGGKAVFRLLRYGNAWFPFASTDFDKGFAIWTIPFDSRIISSAIDGDISIFMDIIPAESGVYQAEEGLCDPSPAYCKIGPGFFRNSLVTRSSAFRIESDFSSFPEKFTYPAGGEKITLGTPIVVTWSPAPVGPNHFQIILEPSQSDPSYREMVLAEKGNLSLVAEFEGDLTGKTGFTWDGKTLIQVMNNLYTFLPGKWRFVLTDYLGHALVGNDFELVP